MSPFLQLAFAIAILVAAAKAGGYLSLRLGQPSVLGELLVGIVLGPSLFDLLHLPLFTNEHLTETVHEFAEIGVLLLMFLAGLDLHLSDLAKSGRVAAFAGILGVLLPLVLGAGVGWMFGMPFQAALFVGLILAATSVSISAQTLMELNVLRSKVGFGLLGAAVFDDILVVLGLSIFTALVGPGAGSQGGGALAILWILLRMLFYLAAFTALGLWLLPRLSHRVRHLPVSQGLVAFTLVVILLYGVAAETIGTMAAITGSFLAGLMLARSPVRDRIEGGVSTLAYGLFVPIFFINVGLSANARELTGESFWLFLVMTIVAVIGKVAGAGYGASLAGFDRRQALQLGVGMMSRGEVGLIVASVGISQGLIQPSTFSAVVGVVIITTLMTPPLLRSLFTQPQEKPGEVGTAPENETTNQEIIEGEKS